MSNRFCIAAMAVVLATAANAQEEQTDPHAELGLTDESGPVADNSESGPVADDSMVVDDLAEAAPEEDEQASIEVTEQEANAQEEQTDPYAELGLIDESAPIADDGMVVDDLAEAPPAEDTAPREISEQDMLLEHARFVTYVDEQNYDQADISAKRVIEMAIRLHGPQSHETAKALNNLGVVQNSTKQYDAAIQNFSSAIEILEVLEDRLNSQLINPLKGLGAAQLGIGRPDLATQAYNRATHITHVNEGPHNVEQVEILESLAEASVRMGDVDTARDVLDRIHILNVRHFADNTLGLLPSLMRRASWQHRAGYYNDERATYRRAIRIIEDSAGKNDPRLVDPLVRLGASFYFFEPISTESPRLLGSSTGEIYLRRATRIAERAEDFPWLELATTKLALADYHIFSNEYSRAKNVYEEVWNELSTDDDRVEIRDELLGDPRPIWDFSLPPATNGAVGKFVGDGEIQTGVVNVYYLVTERGRARVAETTSEPAEFTNMQTMVEREVRRRAYRPMISEGTTVESGPLVFRHEFMYSKSELEDIRTTNASDEQQAAASE
jgi:tetratricopeptide (TPR) repeat protein